jgi:alkyl sulfatase BDS1-like metallo-beta-lactamase superfamily hydrolase
VYELTEWGRHLEPAVLALGRWASGSPSFPRDAEMGPDSLVLALKSTFDPGKAGDLEASYELLLGEIPFDISVRGGVLEAARGDAEDPDATIRSDPSTIAGVVFGENSLGKVVKAGDLVIEGSRQSVARLFKALT